MPNESELIKILLLLSDTNNWLQEMTLQTVQAIHPPALKLLKGKDYRLPVHAFAHIIERHYYKTLRHPGTGKFNIPLPAILDHLKEAALLEPTLMKGSVNFCRKLALTENIGISKAGEPAYTICVITDANGNIITAYPE